MACLAPTVHNAVREIRLRTGLTQAELATAVHVTRQTIGALEQGDYAPSTVLALRLCRVLDRPFEALFWLSEQDTTTG